MYVASYIFSSVFSWPCFKVQFRGKCWWVVSIMIFNEMPLTYFHPHLLGHTYRESWWRSWRREWLFPGWKCVMICSNCQHHKPWSHLVCQPSDTSVGIVLTTSVVWRSTQCARSHSLAGSPDRCCAQFGTKWECQYFNSDILFMLFIIQPDQYCRWRWIHCLSVWPYFTYSLDFRCCSQNKYLSQNITSSGRAM